MLETWQINYLQNLDGWEEFCNLKSTADLNKQKLLQIAKNGEPRPISNKHPLGEYLSRYTNSKSNCYDPIFDKEIKELRSDWFVNSVEKNKKQLLQLARCDKKRPVAKTVLGGSLCRYTNPKSRCYDPIFDKEIRELKPDWWSSDLNKKQLLQLAKDGEIRPNQKTHPLGRCISIYTNSTSGAYDPIFDKKIRKLRPDWFLDGTKENKMQLLQMAKNGEARPRNPSHPLGVVLCNYTNPKSRCYDPIFDKEIKELRSDWFVNSVEENKKQLLQMARNGDVRPRNPSHPLGVVLCSYTNPKSSSYDSIFDKEIKELRSDWFVDTAEENKKQLLQMARNGEPRPNQRKHPLGRCLCTYTNSKTTSYDPKFDKEIRRLRPDWFIDTADLNKKQLLDIAKNGEDRPTKRKHPLGQVFCHYTNKKSRCYDPIFDKEIRKLRPDWFKK